MKTNPLLILCSLLLLLTADSEAAAPSCQRPRLRKEVRDLTPQEWQAYTGAIRQLKASGRYDGYTRIHVQYTQQAHGGQNFLPWHRRLLYDFETDIINLTNGTVRGIPFFDSHSSYGIFDPQSSVYVGNPTGCVTEGPFAGFMAVDGQCVTRAYNASVSAVDPRVIAALILENQPFVTYSDTYEFGQHAAVHSAIGGHMATLTGSTNDPMFFMHHAHVDYIWYKRQWANPQQTYWDLNGQHGGQPVNLQSLIPGPWAENNGRGFQISDTYWTLCYDYQDPSGRTRLKKRQAPSNPDMKTGPFGDLDPKKIKPITKLQATQLQAFNIPEDRYNKAYDYLTSLVDKLNGRLAKGEKVPDLMDIKKSDEVPEQNAPVDKNSGAVGAGVNSIQALAMGLIASVMVMFL